MNFETSQYVFPPQKGLTEVDFLFWFQMPHVFFVASLNYAHKLQKKNGGPIFSPIFADPQLAPRS